MIRKDIIYSSVIISVVFLIYSNTFNSPFQFDDMGSIVNNPAIRDFRVFTGESDIKSSDVPVDVKSIFNTRYVGYLSFAVNYRLHGLDVRGYHFFNILIHAANAILIYWFVISALQTLRVTGSSGDSSHMNRDRASLFAAVTALFFASHPIQTQAVTYIVQRFTSLASFFYLLAIVMYMRFRLASAGTDSLPHKSAKRFALYVSSVLSAVLAMKTKEFAFTLPFVMAIYELVLLHNSEKKKLLYLAPFFLSVILIPLSLTGFSAPVAEADGVYTVITNVTGKISYSDYIYTQFCVIMTYLRLIFLPVNQRLDYDYPIRTSFFSADVLSAALFLLTALAAAVYIFIFARRSAAKYVDRLRLISFGIFWSFVTFFAESGIIPIRDVIFEHRVYLPSIGIFISLSSVIGLAVTRWEERLPLLKNALYLLVLAALIVLATAAYERNFVWKDGVSFWEDTVRKSPGKARAHYNLGLAYVEQGRSNDAIREYQYALKINPYYSDAHNNLGLTYMQHGRIDEAIVEFETLLRTKPDYPLAGQFLEYLLMKRSAKSAGKPIM